MTVTDSIPYFTFEQILQDIIMILNCRSLHAVLQIFVCFICN